MKLCKDCKWCDYDGEFSKCNKTFGRVDPVTGGAKALRFEYCSTQRDSKWFPPCMLGICGKSGRWFEKREGGK